MLRPAPNGGATVELAGDLPAIQLPSSVWIEAGESSASFGVHIPAVDADGLATLSAAFGGAAATAQLTVEALKPTSLRCTPPQPLTAGDVPCSVILNSTGFSSDVLLPLLSSSPNLLVPQVLAVRPHTGTVTFLARALPVAAPAEATVTATFGGASVEETLALTPSRAPTLTVPESFSVAPGDPVEFTVETKDPDGLVVILSAGDLPRGASFDTRSGAFRWVPAQNQAGVYRIEFDARNLALLSTSHSVRIEVLGTRPAISSVHDAASWSQEVPCSAGALATVIGSGFTSAPAELLSALPAPTALANVRVLADGSPLPLLFASANQINFQCPDLPAGSRYKLVVENGTGASEAFEGTMSAAAPAIFTVDGSGKGPGAILLAGTAGLAQPRNPFYLAQPAVAGDVLSIFATGLGPVYNPVEAGQASPADPLARLTMPLTVWVGGAVAEVQFAGLAPGFVGLYQVNAVVPSGAETGRGVAVKLELGGLDGRTIPSNEVTVAVEAPQH